jgi:threonine dehydratase
MNPKDLDSPIQLSEIEAAHAELKSFLPATPLLRNTWLSEQWGCEVYLKLEIMQPIGSFKIRGASYRISLLTKEEKAKGVVAASAGNHAQGVAWGSKKYGSKATIVMPKNAPLNKLQATRALGAEVIQEGDNYDEAYAFAQKLCQDTGKIYVHAFQDRAVIAGQGTIGLEILDQLPDVDVVLGSIGGGGMMAGIATVLKQKKPKTILIGCQASGADSMAKSFASEKNVTLDQVNTFADGIAVKNASEPMRKFLKASLTEIKTADDEAIASAILTLLEKGKVISEGAAAVSLAVLAQEKERFKGRKVVVVLGGGNIDVNVLGRIIDRGLIQAGRRLRINVWLMDRPGSLARLADQIARQGANVLQAIHDRSEPSTSIDETEVNLTLETRGPDHSKAVIEALKSQVLRLELAH